eukprot:4494364-Pyramimonas_sp.AAC.1
MEIASAAPARFAKRANYASCLAAFFPAAKQQRRSADNRAEDDPEVLSRGWASRAMPLSPRAPKSRAQRQA